MNFAHREQAPPTHEASAVALRAIADKPSDKPFNVAQDGRDGERRWTFALDVRSGGTHSVWRVVRPALVGLAGRLKLLDWASRESGRRVRTGAGPAEKKLSQIPTEAAERLRR
jgi:hypothetical protein